MEQSTIPKSAAITTFISVIIAFVAILLVSFANTTIPQACKKIKNIDHECACMSYKGIVGWIQWSHVASGILSLPFLYLSIRLYLGPKNEYRTQGIVLWFFLCLVLVWSVGLYLTERYMYNQCEAYSQNGQYTETTAKYIHRTNLGVMVAIVTIFVCIITVNVVMHFKSKSNESVLNFPRQAPLLMEGGARLDWYWRD
jgi:hypothetical protein